MPRRIRYITVPLDGGRPFMRRLKPAAGTLLLLAGAAAALLYRGVSGRG